MANKVDNAVLGNRIGHSSDAPSQQIEISIKTDGLELSQILYKSIDFFKPNPCNTVFDALKTESQLDALYRDIDNARAIINPLIAMPDGTIVEGHSRLNVAKRLSEEGKGLGTLPVRIITTPLTAEEVKQRVYLGNLSRFEIDEDTRILLYAEIWPDYFYSDRKAGRKSDHGDTITASKISEKLGKSIPQIKRDAAIYRKASKHAGGNPSLSEIQMIRKEINDERRKKEKTRGISRSNRPKVNSTKSTELEISTKLQTNGVWNYSLDLALFFDYAAILNLQGLTDHSLIISYLAERTLAAEQRANHQDLLGNPNT